jgi:hypothetical protein
MAKHRGVARDEFGNALGGASVTVLDANSSDKSTIYSDSELASALDNPFSVDPDGTYVFYASPGYYDIRVAKSGFTTTTLEDEVLGTIMSYFKINDVPAIVNIGTSLEILGNTGLGAAVLSSEYESGFTNDILLGTMTYDGTPTIQAEVLCSLGVGNGDGGNGLHTFSFAVYRDKGGAREDQICVGNGVIANGLGDTSSLSSGGVIELKTGDEISVWLLNDDSAQDYYLRDGFVSVKGLG